MIILLWGFSIPTFVLVFQIFIWRIRKPVSANRALVLMILTALLGFIVLSVLQIGKSSLHICYPESGGALIYALALASSLSLLYFITYTTLDAKSPSTIIILAAHEKKGGLAMDAVVAMFSEDEFIGARIEHLERIGQVRRQDGELFLTLHGRLFLDVFILPRHLMGLRYWGG